MRVKPDTTTRKIIESLKFIAYGIQGISDDEIASYLNAYVRDLNKDRVKIEECKIDMPDIFRELYIKNMQNKSC
jgi:hypothetical protein